MSGFQTPHWIIEKMCGMVDFNPKIILEPTPGEGNMVRVLKNKFPESEIIAPTDYWKLQRQSFDLIFANPPFSPILRGYEFLSDFMTRSENIIILLPWLILINSERRAQKIMQFGLMEIAHLPRNVFPGSRIQCCVMKLRQGYKGDTIFTFWERPC
jgi:type I restriction-modification system DNA methylase subunit